MLTWAMQRAKAVKKADISVPYSFKTACSSMHLNESEAFGMISCPCLSLREHPSLLDAYSSAWALLFSVLCAVKSILGYISIYSHGQPVIVHAENLGAYIRAKSAADACILIDMCFHSKSSPFIKIVICIISAGSTSF